MIMFDWVTFLRAYNIPYIEKGANLTRGDIGLQCPFCGEDDPSQHMGISLSGKGWSCWRNRKLHSGVKPHRLIVALIHCSYAEANEIVGNEIEAPLEADETFGASVHRLLGWNVKEKSASLSLRWPSEIKPLAVRGLGRWFVNYLERRHYKTEEIPTLVDNYDLRYATEGAFKQRLIIPVYDQSGLANWTGRSISSHALVRYRTLSTDPAVAERDHLPVARKPIDALLWNLQELSKNPKGETLIVCEGPFDAMNVDFRMRDRGVRATCLFGKNLSEEQAILLQELALDFPRRYLMLDPDAALDMLPMWERLAAYGFRTLDLPKGVEDPAELTAFQLRCLIR